jgi:hypothetical protein
MIKLYGYGPAWDLPDCSPFVTKVDCYLRMTAQPYTLVPWRTLQDRQNAPKGKFPYIDDSGKKIADSAFILDYLKATYGDPLEEQRLPSHDCAIAHSIRVMLEEHLYWVLVYTQWLEDVAWEAYKPVIFGNLSSTEQQMAAAQAQESVRSTLYTQGVGRHSRAEVSRECRSVRAVRLSGGETLCNERAADDPGCDSVCLPHSDYVGVLCVSTENSCPRAGEFGSVLPADATTVLSAESSTVESTADDV